MCFYLPVNCQVSKRSTVTHWQTEQCRPVSVVISQLLRVAINWFEMDKVKI